MQFGRNHRFGRLGLPGADADFDTLLQRLTDDLASLRDSEHGLKPDLLVVSGDLAELGKKKEFDDAGVFLEKLTEFLGLSRRRVVIVPGNHDINRKKCEAYFLNCDAEDELPQPPFWPKWEFFVELFQRFYRDVAQQPNVAEISFVPNQPWSLFEMPDLKLVVAGLNSTIAELHLSPKPDNGQPNPAFEEWKKKLAPSFDLSHFGHFGRVGETQLRWFAERLKEYERRGWLRIGVVHHNVVRGAANDDENLVDADDLRRELGPHLNLLLHGHTHETRQDQLLSLPIFSTGSTALAQVALPEETPNQYQFLRLRASKIERWTRCFDPRQKRWIADTRSSQSGNEWITTHKVEFASTASATLPSLKKPRRAASAEPLEWQPVIDDDPDPLERLDGFDSARRPLHRDRHLNPFLQQVEAVCKLRCGDKISMTRQSIEGKFKKNQQLLTVGLPIEYLLVTETQGPMILQYPVGIYDREITQFALNFFVEHIHLPFRASNPRVLSKLVYSGERTSQELVDEAGRQGVELLSFTEYQRIIDFTVYTKRLVERLQQDVNYLPELYVTQSAYYEIGVDRGTTNNAVEKVLEWLDEPAGRFVLVLADFGTGKSFLQRQIALQIAQMRPHLTPLLIELRTHEKAHSVEQIIAAHLAQSKEKFINLEALPFMLQQGQIVLLFDGFDELALRTTYEQAIEHFERLLRAVEGNAKLVLTSRRQFFETDEQILRAAAQREDGPGLIGFHAQRKEAFKRAALLPGFRLVDLLGFDHVNVRAYLQNRLKDEQAAARRFELIDRIKDLLGLSSTPRLLSFIVDLEEEKLIAAEKRDGCITSAELYRLLIDRWLSYEVDRHQPPGAVRTLEQDDRFKALTRLACRLWERHESALRITELEDQVKASVQRLSELQIDTKEATHIVGSGTLLTRDADGNFSFAHQSFLEWFVAYHSAEQLKLGEEPQTLHVRELSPLMTDFLTDLADTNAVGQRRVVTWARSQLDSTDGMVSDKRTSNALNVLNRLGEVWERAANLGGQDLVGQDFSLQKLVRANFRNANLSEARFVGADLTNADFTGANLRGADFTQAKLNGAKLIDVNARRVVMHGADLANAEVRSSDQTTPLHQRRDWRFAKLSGAMAADISAWANCDLLGAVLPWASEFSAVVARGSSAFNSVAFSLDGELIASGHDDHTVRLWDAANGSELRQLTGHSARVLSVAFSPDGTQLASASADKSVRLWDATTGRELHQFTGHAEAVWSVAFSPVGLQLASSSADKTVRVWDVTTGRELRQLNGHTNRVMCVAFSPNGTQLASGSADFTLRLWDVTSGCELWQNMGHEGRIWCVAFSPDGVLLATGSADHTVRLWETSTGHELRQLTGHAADVLSVAFSPTGLQLASSSGDKTVRLWDPASGHELRQLNGHAAAIKNVTFSPDGNQLVSGSADTTVRLWDTATGRELRQMTKQAASIGCVAFSPDGVQLASGSDDNTVRLWNAARGSELRRLAGQAVYGSVLSVAFSPDGKQLATGFNNTVRLCDSVGGSELRRLVGHSGSIRSVAFSPNGTQLTSGGDDKTVRVWDTASGLELRKITGHMERIWSVAFNQAGTQLASGSDDKTVRLWGAHTGLKLQQLNGHLKSVRCVVFSPDAMQLVSGSEDKTVRLWDVASGCELRQFIGHGDSVLSVAFSPDGTQLASGSADQTVRLWDTSTGRELRQLIGHADYVRSVAFSPDGTQLASGSGDGTIRLWEVATGRHLATLISTQEGWASFTPDGRRYKLGGNPAGSFWYLVGLCRYEPGELDPFLPPGTLQRLKDDERLW